MIYAILVFLAGCSFGILSPFVKLAYRAGFTVDQVVIAQNYSGMLILLVSVLLFSRKKTDFKTTLELIGLGCITSITGILYYGALQTIPASIAVVLLFQFTWIGIIFESIYEKKLPGKEKIYAVPFLFIGTMMSGGIMNTGELQLNIAGFTLGILSAVSFASFIFLSGKIGTDVPVINKTFYISIGAVLLSSIIYPPTFIENTIVIKELGKYGLLLGFFGVVIPPLLFSKGVPKIGAGISTILSSSELPVATLMSYILLHESISPLQWMGILIILIGISIPYMVSKKTKLDRLAHS